MIRRARRLFAAAVLTAACVAAAAHASEPHRILTPEPALTNPARFERVPPAPENSSHFVARSKHLVEFARAHPATGEWWAPVAGVSYVPALPITAEGMRIFDLEHDEFDPAVRDRMRRCDVPKQVPNATLIRLDAQSGGFVVPAFLSSDRDALRYVELSLDRPGASIVLTITAWNGIAIRVTTSSRTDLVAVHMLSQYASAVLGVEPARVTQQSYPCINQIAAPAPVLPVALPGQKEERYSTEGMKLGQYRIAIGDPQPVRRGRPRLGTIFDPELPLPHVYGRVVLDHLGYIRRADVDREMAGSMSLPAYEVLKPFRVPDAFEGPLAVSLIVIDPSLTPSAKSSTAPIFRPLGR